MNPYPNSSVSARHPASADFRAGKSVQESPATSTLPLKSSPRTNTALPVAVAAAQRCDAFFGSLVLSSFQPDCKRARVSSHDLQSGMKAAS